MPSEGVKSAEISCSVRISNDRTTSNSFWMYITASAWSSALLTESWVWVWRGDNLIKSQDPQAALTDVIILMRRDMQTLINRAKSLTWFVYNLHKVALCVYT